MNGLLNDTTRDIMLVVGLVLAIVQILMALLYPRSTASASASVSTAINSRPSPLQSLFSFALHTDVRSYTLLFTCCGLLTLALSLLCAHSVNLALVRGPLNILEQVESGSRGYLLPLLYMSSGFQAIGLFSFVGLSDDAFDTSGFTISRTRFLSVISATYMLLAVFLFRFADSWPGLQIFAGTQIFALSLAFVFGLMIWILEKINF